MAKTLVLAEKPSVARELARVLGCKQSGEGYLEGEKYIVTWALGHLVELAPPEDYDKAWAKWDMLTLPMLPERMKTVVIPQSGRQFRAVQAQLRRGVKGSIVAMVTPFHEDGSVNFDVLTELLERQIAAGTDGILTLGTTGEYSTMSHEEDAAVVAHTIKVVNGRVPVMVGSGSNCTATQIEKSIEYQNMGADALLLIAPYYNKANPEGMYRHFAETADKVQIPCILYNVPGRTGCSIPVSVVERLSQHPNIAGIKEASGDMSYAMKIARCVGPDFALYSGNDDITVPLMSVGGSGVISVYANVMPAMCHQIVADFLGGNQAQAVANHLKYLQLMNDLFMEVNPIPVKTAMNLLGLNVGPMRLPLCEMSEEHAAALRRTMEEAGLL